MPRASRDTKLETRTNRAKLKSNHEPYWVSIGKKLHLGYRKGTSGGSWIARVNVDGKYRKEKLGKADDFQDADGADILDYFQAQEKTRDFAERLTKEMSEGLNPDQLKGLTVADAVTSYLAWYKLNKKAYKYTEQTAQLYIITDLGHLHISKLTSPIIRKWHQEIAKRPRRSKSKIKTAESNAPQNTEELRKRKATANRILTILKAALNHAWRDGLIESDEAWRKVKPFPHVDHPKIRYLTLTECTRLVNSSDPDFRPLIRAALLTGCRYGELIRLKAADFDAQRKTIHITETKNGKPRHIPLTDEGFHLFKEITAGKLGDEHVFIRDDGKPWSTSHQIRRMKAACERAKITPVVSFHVLRHTYGSLLASKGVPLQVIAELLGHSDTRVTSRHYAHLMPSFVADTLRANLPTFDDSKTANNVVGLI